MRAQFTEDELRAAAQRVLNGEPITSVMASSTVLMSTLKRYVKPQRLGEVRERQRPGPKPVFRLDIEQDLVEWILAMQRVMLPVQPWEILEVANDLCQLTYPATRSHEKLTHGWYQRFIGRHPELCNRSAEPLSRVRQGADQAALASLFYRLSKPMIDHNMGASRIYNMDETSFVSKHQATSVVALRGSSNVWTRSVDISFHLSVVAAVYACGDAAPPLYILPGVRVGRTALDGCNIYGSGAITSEKSFMTGGIFKNWIEHFSMSVPSPVKRPIVLVCDGSSSHLGLAAIPICDAYGINLVQLPPNATHLVQPLDVAIFRGFKREVTKLLRRVARSSHALKVSKKEAVAIASRAYSTKVANIAATGNGFRVCGLFSSSIPSMERQLRKVTEGGTGRTVKHKTTTVAAEIGTAPGAAAQLRNAAKTHRDGNPDWMRVQARARESILVLPPSPLRPRGSRKTMDVRNKIIRKPDMLTSPPRNPRKKAKKANKTHQDADVLEEAFV